MTDLRKAAEMSIEAIMDGDVKDKAAAVYALRQALAQPDEVLAEREACAKVCDLVAKEIDDTNGTATYCATSIRARGEK